MSDTVFIRLNVGMVDYNLVIVIKSNFEISTHLESFVSVFSSAHFLWK